MLNQISPLASPRSKTEDAVDLLTGCHDRIRHFTGAAVKLAHAQGATADDISQTAARVHRYYTVSLPLHEADEEDTLWPRLAVIADERMSHALAAMHEQHQAIDELLDRLQPLLVLVASNAENLHAVAGEMCSITKALDEIFRSHLQMEEEVIFPAIRAALAEGVREEMLGEMRARRER
ncbi:MAG: hemerythrin domain-containing protein [Candidatus Korobacteraceae bacterium]